MESFEYRLLSVEQDPHALAAQLNRAGSQGWDAVTQLTCSDAVHDDLPGHGDAAPRYLLLKRRADGAGADAAG